MADDAAAATTPADAATDATADTITATAIAAAATVSTTPVLTRSSSRPSSRDAPTVSAADRHVTHHIHHRNASPTTITTVSTMSLTMDDYTAQYRLAYKKLAADGLTDSEPSHIIGNIYVGSVLAASNIKHLYEHLHITHILSIGSVPLVSGPFSYYHIDADDHIRHTIKPHFTATNTFLQHSILSKKSNNTLIHCHAGKSRSITILLAFLSYLYLSDPHNLHPLLLPIRHYIQPEDEPLYIGHLLNFIQNKREKAFPNRGFYSQLMNYEDELVNKHNQICTLKYCYIRDKRINGDEENNINIVSYDTEVEKEEESNEKVKVNDELQRVSPSSTSSATSSTSTYSSSSSSSSSLT